MEVLMNMDFDKNEVEINHIFYNIKELVVNSRNKYIVQ